MRQIDVHKIADEAKFNGFHGLVLFWCALIIIFDGYDLAVAGIALPSIMKEMGVEPPRAGFMVSSALFGMMFGAIFLGTIADKIGRRWAIAICIALFSVFTAAAGLTNDPVTFSAMRFLAGLGIGGVMPNVVAQMTEYSPQEDSRHHGHADVQRLCGGRHAGRRARQGPDREPTAGSRCSSPPACRCC